MTSPVTRIFLNYGHIKAASQMAMGQSVKERMDVNYARVTIDAALNWPTIL